MADNLNKENIEDVYPMSDIQWGMVYHALKEPEASLYHNQMIFQQQDRDFDAELFRKAMMLMVEKHPILRTGFNIHSFKEPLQIVFKKITPDIQHHDITHLDKEAQHEHIKAFLVEDRSRPFDFCTSGTLWRLRTYSVGNGNICYIWICHHAITDGWSTASLLTELNNTYLQLKSNPHHVPPKLKNTYKQFVLEQRLEKKNKKTIEYWQNQLAGYKRLNFPPGVNKTDNIIEKKKYEEVLGSQLREKLIGVAKKYNTSLKHLCFAAYVYMLGMISYDNDFVVGLVTHNRPTCEDGDKIMGCFLNTVPFRIKIPASITWGEYIDGVHRKLLELSGYNHLSLPEILKVIGEESGEQNPIFDTLFNFMDFHIYDQIKPVNGLKKSRIKDASMLSLDQHAEINTLFNCDILASQGHFVMRFTYPDTGLFHGLAEDFAGYFNRILNKFIHEPGSMIGKDRLFPEQEREKLLYTFNKTNRGYPGDRLIHELLEEQVEKTPGQVALLGTSYSGQYGEHAITYRELNKRINQLARLLRSKGAAPGIVIGIMSEPSLDLVVGVWAILKAGAAYLPIDPQYPEQRIRYMLDSSGASMVLTHSSCSFLASWHQEGISIILPDQPGKGLFHQPAGPLKPVNTPGDLFYIIFTSGSTGTPKGAGVYQRGFMNLLYWFVADFTLGPRDRNLLITSMSFDLTQKNLYASLITGGTLCLPGGGYFDPMAHLEEIYQYQVSWLNCTPGMFSRLVEYEMAADRKRLSSLRYVFLGGEPIFAAELIRWWESDHCNAEIVNTYGPTECTDICAYYPIKDLGRFLSETIPLGGPIYNVQLFVLDNKFQLLPIGIPGELVIGGDGLGSGYVNDKKLTTEKFIRCSFSDKEPPRLLYRTGDLVKWLPDGNIEFIGRLDHQVKIRGFRIEPGEIENHLRNHAHIKEAAVLSKTKKSSSAENYLCAYIVSDRELTASEMREYVSGKLPDYMIPSTFIQVEKIPLTKNGKIDRKALDSYGKILNAAAQYVDPESEMEKIIANIWQEVLGVDKVGINDNFFDLGGDSLKVLRLNSKLNETLGTRIPVAKMFNYVTIDSFVRYLTREKGKEALEYREIAQPATMDRTRQKREKQRTRRKAVKRINV